MYYGLDPTLQVTSATRNAGEFDARGGPLAERGFSYVNGSDRKWTREDGKDWEFVQDGNRRLTSVRPRAFGCYPNGGAGCTQDTSWQRKDYLSDVEGRMTNWRDTPLPPKPLLPPLWVDQQGKSLSFTPDDGLGSVYKSVMVNGAVYQYLYDAQGRRRLKVYPTGKTDEFFYNADQLIEDRGETTQDINDNSKVLAEYVWLGGMPVAVVKTRLDGNFVRQASAYCNRNDDYDACGTLFILNDYLPKPVALIDSAGRLAGVGEYDVFGKVNEVQVRADVPAQGPQGGYPFGPYLTNQNMTLATLKQPWTGNQRVQMRVNYAQVNTPGSQLNATDKTWVTTTAGQVAPPPCTGLCSGWPSHYAGQMYATTTNWFDVPASGEAYVKWVSGGATPAQEFTGATVRSYEYRKYEAGASPTWLPLRFPGQYADAETGLFENWNRFYDPSTGRYSASDPLLPSPAFFGEALKNTGRLPVAYSYANNAPLLLSDPTGLDVKNDSERPVFVKPDTDGKVIIRDKDGNEREVDAKAGDSIELAAGETFVGGQDGVADPDMAGGKVFKTVDGVDATIQASGEVSVSFEKLSGAAKLKAMVGQAAIGGFKGEPWNATNNKKGDTGWNRVFQSANKMDPRPGYGHTIRRFP